MFMLCLKNAVKSNPGMMVHVLKKPKKEKKKKMQTKHYISCFHK